LLNHIFLPLNLLVILIVFIMEGKYPETHLKAHDLILSFYDTGTFLFLENCIVIDISLCFM